MGGPEGLQEASGTPDTSEKGFATLNSLRYAPKKHVGAIARWSKCEHGILTFFHRIGVKAFVLKVRNTTRLTLLFT